MINIADQLTAAPIDPNRGFVPNTAGVFQANLEREREDERVIS